MNQFQSLERLRPLLRMETAVVVAILIVVVAWYTQSQKTEESRTADATVERSLKAVRQDLVVWDTNNDPDVLREELTVLESVDQGPLALPSREDASQFRIQILNFAEVQGFSLPAFDQAESVASLGEQEYLAIRYSIAARGSSSALVGALSLLQDFPTAAIQRLDFVRPPEDVESWDMNLELDVFFEEEGT